MMKTSLETISTRDLKKEWDNLKIENPKMRIKDCAEVLGVSELELLLTNVQDPKIQLRILENKPADIIARVKDLGYVMALTRNDSCVHERKGIYGELTVNDSVGLIVGPDIDLRIFFREWKYVVAVEEESEISTKRSLQFFNQRGYAVHKIFLNERSNVPEYQKLIHDFALRGGLDPIEKGLEVNKVEKSEANWQDEKFQKEFLDEWAQLKDTHDFHGMLRKNKITRMDAMQVAAGRFTKQLDRDSVRKLFYSASEKNVPIMVFLYNPGNVQIHTGHIKNIVPTGNWNNIMDPEFNLHLREDHISDVWWVNKPTVDGEIQSIEVYDKNQEMIVQFYGPRKPGEQERQDWRDLCKGLN